MADDDTGIWVLRACAGLVVFCAYWFGGLLGLVAAAFVLVAAQKSYHRATGGR